MATFTIPVHTNDIAAQIAALLNAHNKLRIRYNEAKLMQESGHYFVYMHGDKVVGCTAIRQEGPDMTRQYHTCVHPDFRRQGIAAKLKDFALLNVPTEYVFVTIRSDNLPSIMLNLKYGFTLSKFDVYRDHYVYTLIRKAKLT